MYWSAFFVSQHMSNLSITLALPVKMLSQLNNVMQSGLKKLWCLCGLMRP
jgi:hypothetical protein